MELSSAAGPRLKASRDIPPEGRYPTSLVPGPACEVAGLLPVVGQTYNGNTKGAPGTIPLGINLASHLPALTGAPQLSCLPPGLD